MFVERINLCRLSVSSSRDNFSGDIFDPRPVAPGEKNVGSFTRESLCDRAADRAAAP
jgi:hypothetical protein